MQTDTLIGQAGSHEQFHAIRNNDEKAMSLFYQANYPKVEKYILDNNGTAEEAKDIYQEAFIAVWRNIQLGKFEPQQATSLNGYIYQVARNKWIDQLRQSKSRKVIPITDSLNSKEETATVSEEEQQRLHSIKTNFKLLGDMCRDVLERFYYKKESMRTIADAMNWTEATAKNNKYRCLQKLRELLGK